jgi:peroxin-3
VLIVPSLHSLRRWFENNQQNISFTIMALLPTIGANIVDGMDVEGLTTDLQEKSRAARISRTPDRSPQATSPTSATRLHLHEQDSRSDMGSSVFSSALDEGFSMTSSVNLGDSQRSWVRELSADSRSSRPESHGGGGEHSDSPETSSLENSVIESTGNSSAVRDSLCSVVSVTDFAKAAIGHFK